MSPSPSPYATLVTSLFENCALHRHSVIEDNRGSLVAIEAQLQVPFEIKRVYYLFDTPHKSERGFHAHRRLQQWAICIHGACTIVVDDGHERHEVRLDSPLLALQIGPMIWREMRDFSPFAVLLVLASEPFAEEDYIRNYETFQKFVQRRSRR